MADVRPDHNTPCDLDGNPACLPFYEGEHCMCWEECEPCCRCGDHPACPIDDEGMCADCGAELDGDGHKVYDGSPQEALVRMR